MVTPVIAIRAVNTRTVIRNPITSFFEMVFLEIAWTVAKSKVVSDMKARVMMKYVNASRWIVSSHMKSIRPWKLIM